MQVAIIQSSYIPWKGYFDIIRDVDTFVFLDQVQFTVRDWRTRNRIKTKEGGAWLSVPAGSNRNRCICEVQLADHQWQATHWNKMQHAYRNAPFFAHYREFFSELYENHRWTNLSVMNQTIISCARLHRSRKICHGRHRTGIQGLLPLPGVSTTAPSLRSCSVRCRSPVQSRPGFRRLHLGRAGAVAMSRLSAYLLVMLTVGCTVYGQLIIKWKVLAAGRLPDVNADRARFMVALLLNPWVISAFMAAFGASLAWIAAMTRLPISEAYPLNAMTFVLVVVCGGLLFAEPMGVHKVMGIGLIMIGVVVAAQDPS